MKIESPTFTLTVPKYGKFIYTGQTVKVRRLLLTQTASNPDLSMVVENCVKACLVSGQNENAIGLPYFITQLLYLSIISKTTGEYLALKFTCKNEVTKTELCNEEFISTIELDKLKLTSAPELMPVAKINNTYGIILKYLSFSEMMQFKVADELNRLELLKSVIIGYIKDDEKVDLDECEVIDFCDNLPVAHANVILSTIKTWPEIKYTIVDKCPKCGFNHNYDIIGFERFFN